MSEDKNSNGVTPFGHIVPFIPEGIEQLKLEPSSYFSTASQQAENLKTHDKENQAVEVSQPINSQKSFNPLLASLSVPNASASGNIAKNTQSNQAVVKELPKAIIDRENTVKIEGIFNPSTTHVIKPFKTISPFNPDGKDKTKKHCSEASVTINVTNQRKKSITVNKVDKKIDKGKSLQSLKPFTKGEDIQSQSSPCKPTLAFQPKSSLNAANTLPTIDALEDSIQQHYDVIIVGAGPAGLSTAVRLKQLAAENRQALSVCVIEKGAEVGAHILSGAVLEPSALNELIPHWRELDSPVKLQVREDQFLFLTARKFFKLPTPPQMKNHGNYLISLGDFCRWLGKQAEALGVEIYTGVSADEILYDKQHRIIGVKTADLGIDKLGNRGHQFTPGMKLMATYTVFSEGCRGSLSEQLIKGFNLRQNKDPQTYGIGFKEVWEILPQNAQQGRITHTIGWPLEHQTYGGSFLYHLEENKVSIGFVIGLDYQNPHLSPYMEFQRFKHHPVIAQVLRGGQRLSYGARALNEGGYQSIPNTAFPGGVMVGCSAGFLNVAKIKGTHTAMKSGMIAAESIAEAIFHKKPPDVLQSYPQNLEQSWVMKELYQVRNIRPSFQKGLYIGLVYSALDTYLFRGKAPWTFKNHDDHSQMRAAKKSKKIEYPKADGVLSFDRLTNVAFSNTFHRENQRCHLHLKNKDIPITVNLSQYDAPEQRYCPAGVYEIVQHNNQPVLQINAQNCIHCKTCDIKDPNQNIQWRCPEGGGGPNYSEM